MEKKRLLNHLKPSGRSLSLPVMLLVTAMTLLPQSMWGQTEYGFSIGGTEITSENISSYSGLTFDSETNTLTLNGAYVQGSIMSGLNALTIRLVGSNEVQTISYSGEGSGTLTIMKDANSEEAATLNLSFTGTSQSNSVISGFSSLTTDLYMISGSNVVTYDTNSKQVLDASGAPVTILTITNEIEKPSLYGGYNSDNNTYTFGFEGEGEIHYSIYYVNDKQEDVKDATYEMGQDEVELLGAATVTAWRQVGSLKSAEVKGKLFELSKTTLSVINGKESKAQAPALVPGVEVGDGVTVTYSQSSAADFSDIATINETTGEMTIKGPGTAIFLVTVEGSENSNVFNEYNEIPLSFTLSVEDGYPIWINDGTGEAAIRVTEENREHILGENNTSVRFDGNKTLILDHATLTSIESSLSEGGELKVFLIGENTVTHMMDTGQQAPKLTIETAYNNPGRLTLGEYGNGVVMGFSGDDIVQPLAILSPDGVKSLIGTTAAISNATIGAPLNLIIDNVTETAQGVETNLDYSNPTGDNAGVASSSLTNTIINNVLYTLHDTQTAGATDDGYDTDTKQIVLNSLMTDGAVKEVNSKVEDGSLLPGTNDYASSYNGLTFMVPAGTGTISLETNTAADREFHLMVGDQDPVTVINKEDNDNAAFSIDYAVSKSTYVYLYLVEKAAALASSRGSHRIGPKSGIGGGLGALSVKSLAEDIASPAVIPSNYKMCTASMVTYSGTGGIIVDDATVTDIDAAAFVKGGSAASRRALYENVPFVDLSQTSIVGKDISRSEGAFEGFPESTLIYLPAGNTSSEPNIIIGKVCEKMVLNGADNNTKAFELIDKVTEFTAANAKLERSFGSVSSTVYLPFGISKPADYGDFWTISAVDTEKLEVTLTKAATVEANTAYVFIPKEGVTELEVKNTKVKKLSVPSDAKLQGTYEVKDYEDGMYCYAGDDEDDIKKGDFVKMGSGSKVPPFRAYFKTISAGSRFTTIWDGDDTTGLRSVLTDGFDGQNLWYDLNGRRIDKPATKGIFIHNGKKYINK